MKQAQCLNFKIEGFNVSKNMHRNASICHNVILIGIANDPFSLQNGSNTTEVGTICLNLASNIAEKGNICNNVVKAAGRPLSRTHTKPSRENV